MTKTNLQKGFTLVELAIVMTIIGLLIGGILKGQELMQTARVTATVAQLKSYEAAVTNFRDSFQAIPGDMQNGQTRLQGCTAACNNSIPATSTTGAGGDGLVGLTTWASGTAWAAQSAGTNAPVAAITAPGDEAYLFWMHLLMANLIGGVTNQALSGTTTGWGWGVTHPAAKIAGGFIVGNTNGVVPPGGASTVANSGPTGLTLALVSAPTSKVDTAGPFPLQPNRAAQIDRKMDDGRPDVGYVQGFGQGTGGGGLGSTTCELNVAPFGYNEGNTTYSCGLLIRLQG